MVAQSDVTLASVAPTLFTANQNGQGVPIGLVVTAQGNGSLVTSYASTFQGNAVGSYAPVPIQLGGAGTETVLELYGTGIRGAASLSNVTVTIGTVNAPVQYAGPADPSQFVALDQVNVSLPQSLAGAGQVNLTLRVNGVAAPPVTLDF